MQGQNLNIPAMYYKIIYTVKGDFEGHVSIKRRQQPYSHNLLADPAETRDVSARNPQTLYFERVKC